MSFWRTTAAIVAACESHRDDLLPRLHNYGLDMGKAIEEDRYIALDAADRLSKFMLNGIPDPVRFMTLFDDLIPKAAKAAKSEHPARSFSENACICCGRTVTQRRRFKWRNSETCSRKHTT